MFLWSGGGFYGVTDVFMEWWMFVWSGGCLYGVVEVFLCNLCVISITYFCKYKNVFL